MLGAGIGNYGLRIIDFELLHTTPQLQIQMLNSYHLLGWGVLRIFSIPIAATHKVTKTTPMI